MIAVMSKSSYQAVSGGVFGAIAVAQVLRAAGGSPVQVGSTVLPAAASWVIAVVAALLSLWAFASVEARPSSPAPVTPPTGAFQGLRLAVYHVGDLERAKAWYSAALGAAPCFSESFYVGFDVEGSELGLDPDREGAPREGKVVAFWGVRDAEAAYRRLIGLGAAEHRPVHEVGGGIRVGTVLDPFGNLFGIIQNPHFDAAAAK